MTDFIDSGQCVKCGYCCMKFPCPYGKADEKTGICIFLTEDNLCSKYNEIIKDKDSILSPAFGAGCSSTMFNPIREAKIRTISKGERK